MRSLARAGLLLSTPWALGCYSTSAVPAESLPQRGLSRPAALATSDGAVKLDPNSRVRLLRLDGLYTPWVSASDLYIDANGISVHDDERNEGLAWAEVQGAEVENLNGGVTAVAVVGVSALIVGVVLMALSSKGGGGSSSAGGAVRAADGAIRIAGAASRSGGGTRASEPVHHGTASTFGSALGPLTANSSVEPIFDEGAQRRSLLRLTGAIDAARGFTDRGPMQAGAVAALRLWNFIEVGGGGRMIGTTDAPSESYRTVAFGRVGVHGELDARRRLALPFSVDLGGGARGAYARLNGGLRVRVYDEVSIGLYPFNPTFDQAGNRKRPWTFQSGVETSFAF